MIDTKKSCKNFECSLEISNIILYYVTILFQRKYFAKGGATRVTSFELIWRLIVLLLLSNSYDESQDTNKE